MSLFPKKKKHLNPKEPQESEIIANKNESEKPASISSHEKKQDALIENIRKSMLTEADVRRIISEELIKIFSSKEADSPVLKVIAENNKIEIVDDAAKNEIDDGLTFADRVLKADEELKECYNELKIEALSYGLKSRLSNSGDTFRLHAKTYMKISLVGKSLKCFFALNPENYVNSSIPISDVGLRAAYKDIPLVFKVKSPLSLRRAKLLLSDACKRDGLYKDDPEYRDWISPLKSYVPQIGKK